MTSAQEMMSRFSGVKSAGKNAAFLIVNQFISIVIRLFYLFILVRSVAPASYGVLTYALSWYLVFLPFTYLGADVVLSRGIARARSDAPYLLGATLGSRLVAAPAFLSISFLVALVAEPDPQVRSLVAIFSLSLLGRSLWMWTAAAFTAFEETNFVLRYEVAARLFEVCSLLLLLKYIGPDLHWIAAIHAVSWLLQGGVAAIRVGRRYGIKMSKPDVKWLTVVREGIPGASFSIAMAAFFQLPIILFRMFQGTGDTLGYFALAFQIVTYLLTIPYSVANASLPVLSRSAERQDGKDRKAVAVLAALIIVGGATAAMAASQIALPAVEWVFGNEFGPAAFALVDGLWLLIPASLAMLFQQIVFSRAMGTWLAIAGPAIGVLVMFLLFPFLENKGEFAGPLAAVAGGFIAWLFCALFEISRAGFFRKSSNRAAFRNH